MGLFAIANNTFKETVRNRTSLNILVFAVALILFSFVAGDWSMGHQVKVMKDLGLGAMSIFGLLIAIFIGIRIMIQELEQKTIYLIASKPICRWEIIVGKFIGLALTLLIHLTLMTFTLYIITFIMERSLDWGLLSAIWLIYIEILLLVAFSIFFSSFTSPTLSAIYTFLVFIIGHLSDFLRDYVLLYPDKGFHGLLKVIYAILPNLEKFNLKMAVVQKMEIAEHFVLFSSFYGIAYLLLILILTCLIYQKKDFK